jgi:transposase
VTNLRGRNGSKALFQYELGLIDAYKQEGKTNVAIAKILKCSESAVRAYLKRKSLNLQNGQFGVKAETRGRKRKTTAFEDRQIMVSVKRAPFTSLNDLKKTHPAAAKLSLRMISSRIKESGEFNSYWAARKPLITPRNRLKRLQWAREHVDWTNEQWDRVLWSDESPYVLRFKAKQKIWRKHNERYLVKNCVATVKHDDKIMVWGAFASSGVGILHRIYGIMDQNVYRNLLENVMMPSVDIVFGDREHPDAPQEWIFQQDNDPKHSSRLCKQFLIDNDVQTFEWPSQSPDLNPIENLWSILEFKTKKRSPNNCRELFEILQQEWNQLSVDLLRHLVHSMRRRCEAVIESRGYPTKY